MANAKRDSNYVTTLLATLETDGESLIRLQANPTTHILDVSDGDTGSTAGDAAAARDSNGVTTLMAVSSSDGSTIVPLFADANGNLLVKST